MYTAPHQLPPLKKNFTLDQALLLESGEQVTFSLDPYKNDLRESFERHFAKIGLHHNSQYSITAIETFSKYQKEKIIDSKHIYELMLKVKDHKNQEIELSYRWFRT